MSLRPYFPRSALLGATVAFCVFQPLRPQAASVVVTTLANSGTGSLRAALADANPGDLITFAVTGTITNLTGELLIDKDLAIEGPGAGNLAVSGNNASRVFNIAGGATVSLSGLTICNGHAADGAAATSAATPGSPGSDGGGIYNSGTLALTNCIITACRSGRGGAGYTPLPLGPPFDSPYTSDGGVGGNGGGICNLGTLAASACTFSFNTNGSGGSGGGARLGTAAGAAGAPGGGGGGIYDAGAVTLIACTLSSNSAGPGGAGGYGGAGDSSGPDGLAGGWGGDGGSGGGLCSQSSPSIIACTFAGNNAGAGGQGGAGGAGASGNFPRGSQTGNGGPGASGGTGGSGGGLYCPAFFQSVACTFTANGAGKGGGGGPGGHGGMNFSMGRGGNGGNGGSGGGGGAGGGISSWGSSTLQNTLVAQNAAAVGGVAGAGGVAGSGTPAGASGSPGTSGTAGAGPDLYGAFSSNGHNLVGLDNGNSGLSDGLLGDIVGSGTPLDPLVGVLTNNGGAVFTCALLAGSPALDTGDDALLDAPFSLTSDARSLPRRSGSHVDIGAFEVQWASCPIRLSACTKATNGAIQMTVTNIPGASLTVLVATNPLLPLSAWSVLGSVPETSAGRFQFTDPAPTNTPRRFYRVRCP